MMKQSTGGQVEDTSSNPPKPNIPLDILGHANLPRELLEYMLMCIVWLCTTPKGAWPACGHRTVDSELRPGTTTFPSLLSIYVLRRVCTRWSSLVWRFHCDRIEMFWRFAQAMCVPTMLRFSHDFERDYDGRVGYSEVIAHGRYMLVPHKLVNGTVMYRRLDGHMPSGPHGGFLAFKNKFEHSRENPTDFDMRHDIYQNLTSMGMQTLPGGSSVKWTTDAIRKEMKKGHWCLCHTQYVTSGFMKWNWSQKGVPSTLPLGKWERSRKIPNEVDRDYKNTQLVPISHQGQWLAKMKAPLAYPDYPGIDPDPLRLSEPVQPDAGGPSTSQGPEHAGADGPIAPPRSLRILTGL